MGNARDLAESSAVAEASVDRFGNATVRASAEAQAASVGFGALLVPLIGLGVALTVALAPALVLATTFGVLGGGIVALAVITGTASQAWNKLLGDLQKVEQHLGSLAAGPATAILRWLDGMLPLIDRFGTQLITWFSARLPVMLAQVNQIVGVAITIVVALLQAWGHLVDWFMANWAAWWASIHSIFDQIGTGANFVLPLLGLVKEAFEKLGPVIQFVRDHADSLKPILYAVGGLLVVMAASAMLTAGVVLLLVAAVVALAAAISVAVSWLRDHLPGAIAAVGGAFSALGTWVNGVADAFGRLVGTAEAAAGAIGHARDQAANIPVIGGVLHAAGIPGFAEGGTVPGALGAPMLAVVHGGEKIVPPGAATASSTYNINVGPAVLASKADIGRAIVEAIQEYERRGSKAWRQ